MSMYVLELGDKEVVVELIRKGSRSNNIPPTLSISGGMDWDGDEYLLDQEDKDIVVSEILTRYPHEVYAD
jgi:hypothetical protein